MPAPRMHVIDAEHVQDIRSRDDEERVLVHELAPLRIGVVGVFVLIQHARGVRGLRLLRNVRVRQLVDLHEVLPHFGHESRVQLASQLRALVALLAVLRGRVAWAPTTPSHSLTIVWRRQVVPPPRISQ